VRAGFFSATFIRMSIRLEMLQVARLAPKILGESTDLVRDFLHRQQNQDGGFKDRSGRSDLYYTVFGLEGLLALQTELPRPAVDDYLLSFRDGANLDFVHLCCLARCWAGLSGSTKAILPNPDRIRLLERIRRFRSHDSGFHLNPGSASGTVYAAFLAAGAHQDLQTPLAEPDGMLRSLTSCETPDGAWANERGLAEGSTNSTAAAVTLLRQLGAPVKPQAGDWLLGRAHPQGGFRAAPAAPLPDLLSTATSLHALAGLQCTLAEPFKERCLDFVDSLWTNEGGFHGHWGEDTLDSEYTYYGLLALGHLSL
jgi:prenyltransferase beta subunit